MDGKRRAAFLAINGQRLTAYQPDMVLRILAFAAGQLPEDDLARWIETNLRGAS